MFRDSLQDSAVLSAPFLGTAANGKIIESHAKADSSKLADSSKRVDNRYLLLHAKADSAVKADTSLRYDNRYLGLHAKADSSVKSDTSKKYDNRYLGLHAKADSAVKADTALHAPNHNVTIGTIPVSATASTWGNSIIQDNGTAIGVNRAPLAPYIDAVRATATNANNSVFRFDAVDTCNTAGTFNNSSTEAYAYEYDNGSTNSGSNIGFYAEALKKSGGGTLTDNAAFSINFGNASAGTLTNNYGISLTQNKTGNIGTSYGLKYSTLGAGTVTNDWFLYSNVNSPSWLTGSLAVGGNVTPITPLASLHSINVASNSGSGIPNCALYLSGSGGTTVTDGVSLVFNPIYNSFASYKNWIGGVQICAMKQAVNYDCDMVWYLNTGTSQTSTAEAMRLIGSTGALKLAQYGTGRPLFTSGTMSLAPLTAAECAEAVSGTTNYLARFTGANTVGNGLVYDDLTSVGINCAPQTIGAQIKTLDIRSGTHNSGDGAGLLLGKDNAKKGVFYTVDDNLYIESISGYTDIDNLKVGINTLKPYGGTGVGGLTINGLYYPVLDFQYHGDTSMCLMSGSVSHFDITTNGNRYLSFGTNDLERMRILSNGKVIVAGNDSIGGDLHVNGATYTTNIGLGTVGLIDCYANTPGLTINATTGNLILQASGGNEVRVFSNFKVTGNDTVVGNDTIGGDLKIGGATYTKSVGLGAVGLIDVYMNYPGLTINATAGDMTLMATGGNKVKVMSNLYVSGNDTIGGKLAVLNDKIFTHYIYGNSGSPDDTIDGFVFKNCSFGFPDWNFFENIGGGDRSLIFYNGRSFGTSITFDTLGDVYSNDYHDYFNSSTKNGWASYVSGTINIKSIGKTLFCEFNIAGTANSDVVTYFSLPVTPAFSYWQSTCVLTLNGTTSIGIVEYFSTNTIAIYTGSGSNLPTSGNKTVNGSFSFQIK
jgi:hypothetical protein